MNDPYVVVGGGAIGGTLAVHLCRAGLPVRVVDSDPAHVAAIRADGLRLRRADGTELVAAIPADLPGDAPDDLRRVLLAVKAQATDHAIGLIAPRLRPDGYVVSLQNGLNEARIADAIGPERTVGAFVNIFADIEAPGVVRDGGEGALVVGELNGRSSDRVEALVRDLRSWGPARSTGNLDGYLWSKLAFGTMLTATALVDAPMAEILDRHRGVMHAAAWEVLAVAVARGIEVEPFDRWDPSGYLPGTSAEEADRATDRLTAWLRTMPKDRSGIWRDIAVRKRPVEVHDHYAAVFDVGRDVGLDLPVLRAVLETVRGLEQGLIHMGEHNLDALTDGSVTP